MGGKEVEVSVAPKVEVRDGVLQVTYDGGTTWIDLVDTLSIVPSEDGDEVTFTLGDTEVTIPLVPAFAIKVETTKGKVDPTDTEFVADIPYEIKGAAEGDEVVVLATYAPAGFNIVVEENSIKVSAAFLDGTIVITAVNNTTGATSSQAITFKEAKILNAVCEAYIFDAIGGTGEIKISRNIEYTVASD